MSEIDKPEQAGGQPDANHAPEPAAAASDSAQASGQDRGGQDTAQFRSPATPGEAPGEPAAYGTPGAPGAYGSASPAAGQAGSSWLTGPYRLGPASGPYGSGVPATDPFGSAAPAAGGAFGSTGSSASAVGQPAYATAGMPVSGPGAPTSGPGVPGEPPTGHLPPAGGGTAQYPHWTPPSGSPKKFPTAAKVLIGGVAAVVLALCSGVTGAVVANSLDNGGFEIPVSGNAAPVVDRSTLSSVAASTQPSVVSISAGQAGGSGVVVSKDGYIVTNNHVVESVRAGGNVTVTLSDGRKVRATVVGTDPRTDLAVVKADAGTDLVAAKFADSTKVAVGDTVLAIGSPLGLDGSVTSGIISAKDRTIRAGQTAGSLSGLLQTDAPINPGNSGGALVNTNGEVVGINTAIATSGGGDGNIGVGFAIPSNKAKQVAEQLINGKKVSHAYLGVSVEPAENGGARIVEIAPNSPAAAAGLREGDIISKFGDRVINDDDDLVSSVQSSTVGQKVTVEFNRNNEKQSATVTLGEAS